jgi:ABC-2 type transport system ATP-binding protein
MAVVELRRLTVAGRRHGRPRLHRLDAAWSQGLHLLTGPAGAGKSTLLAVLAGLCRPTEGSASVEGVDILRAPVRARGILGYAPEPFRLPMRSTLIRYLDQLLAMDAVPPSRRRREIAAVVAALGLGEHLRHRLSTLPPAVRRRVALARALLPRPRLLLVDEPLLDLDPAEQHLVLTALKRQAAHATVLVASRVVPSFAPRFDSVLALDAGRPVVFGRPDDLLAGLKLVQGREPATLEDAILAFYESYEGDSATRGAAQTALDVRLTLTGFRWQERAADAAPPLDLRLRANLTALLGPPEPVVRRLFGILTGRLPHPRGEIRLDGERLAPPELRRLIQEVSLPPSRTADALLDALTRARGAGARLLLLAWPTARLDALARRAFWRALTAFLRTEPDLAVLVATPFLDEVRTEVPAVVLMSARGLSYAGWARDLPALAAGHTFLAPPGRTLPEDALVIGEDGADKAILLLRQPTWRERDWLLPRPPTVLDSYLLAQRHAHG